MSMLLRGAPAAAALDEKTAQLVSGLREKGVVPTLAIVRLGAREDDLSYERAASARSPRRYWPRTRQKPRRAG